MTTTRKIKTYRPVHLNMEADLLRQLDAHRKDKLSRVKLIHEAVRLLLDQLDGKERRPEERLARQ